MSPRARTAADAAAMDERIDAFLKLTRANGVATDRYREAYEAGMRVRGDMLVELLYTLRYLLQQPASELTKRQLRQHLSELLDRNEALATTLMASFMPDADGETREFSTGGVVR